MIELKLYDKIKLNTEEIARIVDIVENKSTTGYVVDIEEGDDYRTETIFIGDIKSVYVEIETPLASAV